MLRSVEEFQRQAKKKGIDNWVIHHCSICGYPCGFIIEIEVNRIRYDSGCLCRREIPRLSSWEELAECYNRNQPENNKDIEKSYIKEVEKFWGFERTVDS